MDVLLRDLQGELDESAARDMQSQAGLRLLMIEGLPFASVLKEFFILLVMTVAWAVYGLVPAGSAGTILLTATRFEGFGTTRRCARRSCPDRFRRWPAR